ncbi:hypothetical protein SAMN02745136_00427 [Anaerocolumna jejuensis DSM 15929]|uniref:Fibronectin type-III domain-containing protein n=1 Tax=Anaerocolumna jejuensis DSM 15929 TaxID=1121322 RepID=A0A1M6KEU7_9FIRM|nr:hypothetical protein [Anaerocolumna jejuensis]SHJ57448.1 hypothetical protein SAMN02745136_00427 [Anaerocolumna jejuensis DSM 15929]
MFKIRKCMSILLTATLLICLVFSVSPKIVYANTTHDLVFGESYTFDGTGGMQRFDLTLEKSGSIDIKFVSNSTDGSSGVFVYTEGGNKKLTSYGFTGSYKKSIDLKAGTYVLIFNYSNGTKGTNIHGEPYDNSPANGIMSTSFTDANETYAEDATITNDEYGVASNILSVDNAILQGQFALNDSVDYYTFSTTQAQNLNLYFSSKLDSVNIQLFNDLLDFDLKKDGLVAGSNKFSIVLPKGTYYLAVKNAKTDFTGNYQLKLSTSDITKTSIKSLKSPKKSALNITVNKQANITGYQIQIATNSTFTQNKKSYLITSNSKSITNLKSKITYYVKVRTYSTAVNGEKCYSSWSAIKSVNIK